MSLRNEIEIKLKKAIKERNKLQISTLRLILSAIKDRDIATRTNDNKEGVKDVDIKQILKKMIKQRKESLEFYDKNKRADLAEIEKGEIEIISTFLPKQLNEAETLEICKETVQLVKAEGPKDIGKVMGELKKKYSDVMDFSKVGIIIKEILK